MDSVKSVTHTVMVEPGEVSGISVRLAGGPDKSAKPESPKKKRKNAKSTKKSKKIKKGKQEQLSESDNLSETEKETENEDEEGSKESIFDTITIDQEFSVNILLKDVFGNTLVPGTEHIKTKCQMTVTLGDSPIKLKVSKPKIDQDLKALVFEKLIVSSQDVKEATTKASLEAIFGDMKAVFKLKVAGGKPSVFVIEGCEVLELALTDDDHVARFPNSKKIPKFILQKFSHLFLDSPSV
jgi:hypothetical protein